MMTLTVGVARHLQAVTARTDFLDHLDPRDKQILQLTTTTATSCHAQVPIILQHKTIEKLVSLKQYCIVP